MSVGNKVTLQLLGTTEDSVKILATYADLGEGYIVVYENGVDVAHSSTKTYSSGYSESYTISGLDPRTTYTASFYDIQDSATVSDEISFFTIVNREKILYGPVNNVATDINDFYGSVLNKSRKISKMYGSVNGQSVLTYIDLGRIPNPGEVVFYTDNTYTTTDTARILNQTDLNALSHNSSSVSSITIDGKTFATDHIKEVSVPEWATTTPDYFLGYCDKLDTVTIPYNVVTIGNSFLSNCAIFNQALDLTFITSIGNGFLEGCVAYNQSVDLPSVTSIGDNFLAGDSLFNQSVSIPLITVIPNNFLYNCSVYNQSVDLTNVTSIGDYFLSGTAFNQSLNLSSVSSIGNSFLQGATDFNQPLLLSNNIVFIGSNFLYNCNSMVSSITCNTPPDIATTSNYTFSTNDSTADSYVVGTSLGGRYATDWITRFPSRNIDPYRNVGYANDPVIYDIEPTENTTGIMQVDYGVVSWDMNNAYTSGTITLYGGTSPNPSTQLDTYNNTGINVYTHTGIVGNTRYYYKASATNNGGFTTETDTSVVSKPAPVSISATDIGYSLYNKYARTFELSIPANGNVYGQLVEYRLKASSDADFGAWETVGEWNSASAGVMGTGIEFTTDTPYVVEFRVTTLAGSTTATYNQPAVPTHIGPTGVEFTLDDANTSLQTWLSSFSGYSDENWFIAGQSLPRVTIPLATAGSTTDGAELTQYEAVVVNPNNGYSYVINYEEADMDYTFPSASIESRNSNGDVEVNLIAQDSLHATNTYTQSGKYLGWYTPTFSATVTRSNAIGGINITASGSYSGLRDPSLNDNKDINSIKIEYKVVNYSGEIVTDWTQIDPSDITINEVRAPILNRNYSTSVEIFNLAYAESSTVILRLSDHFYTSDEVSVVLSLWNNNKTLYPADYTIELWDWKTNTFVVDLSYLVVDSLEITWELNDVEEVNFSIDLLEFEKKCKDMGVQSEDLLKPYTHDIRIRRNGQYIIGCQLVEASTKVGNNPPIKISIKGTGFLNLFKDQYILNEAWSGYTYAQIARKLVEAAQKPDSLIKNPTGDIDTSYWLAGEGVISYSTNSHSGAGCIMNTRSGTGWMVTGSQMDCDSGQLINIDVWVKGQNGRTLSVREKRYITQWQDQATPGEIVLDGSWQHLVINNYMTCFEDSYICFEYDRTDSSSPLYIDDCYIYPVNDNASLNNLNVQLGVDTASIIQDDSREVNYELQNVKDAIIDLTSLEDDNFEFDFSPDRTFNVYNRKGEDKLNLEITYPGNVDTMTISRSAANLANKIVQIGSGIGDERMQVEMPNNVSRQKYGTRESVITDSNVSLESTLRSLAISSLYDRKDPTNLPTVTIRDGSINPANVQTGDTVLITLEGDKYLQSTSGEYRVVKVKMALDENSVESMSLTLEKSTQRPEKKMVRYIRDSVMGSSANTSAHWSEIQALVLIGNDYLNVALGATATGNLSWYQPASLAVDGDINTYADMPGNGRKAITIDLGDEYPLDYVKIWHYYTDNRVYYGEHLSVGTSLPDGVNGTADLDTVLVLIPDNTGYVETSEGRKSKWIQEDNIVWGGEES